MINIGIFAGGSGEYILSAIHKTLSLAGQDAQGVEAMVIGDNPDDFSSLAPLHILIMNDFEENIDLSPYIDHFARNAVIILNADEKKPFSFNTHKPLKFVTYGFNPKSSVTASSIVESEYKTIQCCIQRGIPTFTGDVLEPQEFSVNVQNGRGNIYPVLSAVTASLLSGADVLKINSHVFL